MAAPTIGNYNDEDFERVRHFYYDIFFRQDMKVIGKGNLYDLVNDLNTADLTPEALSIIDGRNIPEVSPEKALDLFVRLRLSKERYDFLRTFHSKDGLSVANYPTYKQLVREMNRVLNSNKTHIRREEIDLLRRLQPKAKGKKNTEDLKYSPDTFLRMFGYFNEVVGEDSTSVLADICDNTHLKGQLLQLIDGPTPPVSAGMALNLFVGISLTKWSYNMLRSFHLKERLARYPSYGHLLTEAGRRLNRFVKTIADEEIVELTTMT